MADCHRDQSLSYLDYGTTLGLSRLYSQQARIADLNRSFFGVVYTPAFGTGGTGPLVSTHTYLSDISANEDQLLAQYGAEVPVLDSLIGSATSAGVARQ